MLFHVFFLYFFSTYLSHRYDMEDAMILNKSSVERGMCHGQIYQVRVPILIFFFN